MIVSLAIAKVDLELLIWWLLKVDLESWFGEENIR